MIGVGPFVTIPLLLGAMHGPQAILGWVVGALVALCDGLAWAELGAAMPQTGGGYRYLIEAYGPRGAGRLMGFLFLWLIVITGPLVLASGAAGFAHYAAYLFPAMTAAQGKLLAIGVCVASTILIYRRIDGVARWNMVFGGIVLAAVLWIAGEGLLYGRLDRLQIASGAFHADAAFWGGLGSATLYAMYTYNGYNTVCFLGGEVMHPKVVIPRSIVIAILSTAVLYIAMTASIVSVLPWQTAMRSNFVASDFIARLHGPKAAAAMTVSILLVTLAGIYAGMLGLSRVPYAAAEEGQFFSVFARLHPTRRFPTFAVLFTGAATALACLVELDALIKLCIVMGIAGSLAVVGAPVALRRTRPDIPRPFRMWLYPLPVAIAAAGWIFIAASSGLAYILGCLAMAAIGIAAFHWRERHQRPRRGSIAAAP